MRILALEPYYGGSHRAFLDQWVDRSRHQWQRLTLPPHHWKWRMRHAGISFAEQVAQMAQSPLQWDVILASDMLDLAQFLGLSAHPISVLPCVAYFHENQLTYPDRFAGERDLHYALTNFTTALAADEVWFNSDFHRQAFLDAADTWLRKMPDFAPTDQLGEIRRKSVVQSPGVDVQGMRRTTHPGPLRIAWAARWEHDKDPATFFEAIRILKHQGIDFRLTVCGQQFRDEPTEFAAARDELAEHVDHWGHAPTRHEYLTRLSQADLFVSTAVHEFFGISVVESISLGLFPLLPDRLSYPELLGRNLGHNTTPFLYDGTATDLARQLVRLASNPRVTQDTSQFPALTDATIRYSWLKRAREMDMRLAASVHRS